MNKEQREHRNYSYLFFFYSLLFSGFLIKALYTETGIGRIISAVLFSFLIFQLLRVAFLMRRKSQDLDLK